MSLATVNTDVYQVRLIPDYHVVAVFSTLANSQPLPLQASRASRPPQPAAVAQLKD
jgi:hypothetical protein